MADKKRNQIFNYLYVMAIIMVIDDHTSTRIGFLASVFPYNSFYMPLFVFISGYFFKSSGIVDNIKHKTRKLLIPYVIWNIVAAAIACILDKFIGTNWITKPSLRQILETFISGSLTSLNGASWFVIMLFWISIGYNLLRNILKDGIVNDIILTISHLLLGFISLYLCVNGYYSRGTLWVFALKIAFYIQFFHYGYMFKKYIEQRLLRVNKVIVCSICIAINVLLTVIYGSEINFYATSAMASFHYWYLPVITSATGIIFYYEVMEFLARKIGQNPLVDFISRNTFVIMQIHLLFVNIPNFYVYFQILNGSIKYADFDINRFINGAWVRYSPNSRLVGFFCGLLGSLLVAWILEWLKKKWKNSRIKNIPIAE